MSTIKQESLNEVLQINDTNVMIVDRLNKNHPDLQSILQILSDIWFFYIGSLVSNEGSIGKKLSEDQNFLKRL